MTTAIIITILGGLVIGLSIAVIKLTSANFALSELLKKQSGELEKMRDDHAALIRKYDELSKQLLEKEKAEEKKLADEKFFKENYAFFDPYGLWFTEKETGRKVCTCCIQKSPRAFVYLIGEDSGNTRAFACPACRQKFGNPAFIAPPPHVPITFI